MRLASSTGLERRSPRGWPRWLAGAAALIALFAWVLPAQAGTGTWSATDAMATGRVFHTITLLPGGKVLVTGGIDGDNVTTTSAELYDPATSTWSGTGAMATGRRSHTATLLPDGRVLVTGGVDSGFVATTSAELYDPATGTWSDTGDMATGRLAHTATLLPDGNVLVATGRTGSGSGTVTTTSAELYDPATGTWSGTGALATGRSNHTATLLPDGQVLVATGLTAPTGVASFTASAELYDPATGTWSGTGSTVAPRQAHTATLLPDGNVLLAGGLIGPGNFTSATAELYDPASGTWSNTNAMATARWGHSAALLPGGQVLVAGGSSSGGVTTSAELYDPATGTWSGTGDMETARGLHAATLLPDGNVLVAGGLDGANARTASAEIYEHVLDDGVPPVVTDLTADPAPLPVDDVAILTATIDDSDTGGSNITDAEYRINDGAWQPMDPVDGEFDAVTEEVTATIGPFSTAQVVEVCVRGSDAAGNTGDPQCILLAVYDAAAGFVTGAGWIDSPPGALHEDPVISGRAHFGFVSRYDKGATIPSGNTQFRFRAGDFVFHSAEYEWLVISSHTARYKGLGTINGAGDYGFLLSATDSDIAGGGDVDTFRLHVWDKATGETIYDNGSQQPIGAGSIRIVSGN